MQKSKIKNLCAAEYKNFAFRILHFDFARKRGGFTMVEIVVMLGIIVAISAIVLQGFPGFNQDAALFRSAQEIALNLRRAQNNAFAVTEVALESGGRVVPFRIGVHFDTATPSEYFLFVDQNQDNIYTSGIDSIIEGRGVLIRGVTLTELKDELNQTHSAANIVFTSPEANTAITNNTILIGGLLRIKLQSPDLGGTKTVTVRTSGQISIQ